MSIGRILTTKIAIAVLMAALPLQFARAAESTPLLDYALSQTFESSPEDIAARQRAKDLQRTLDRHPPPKENCSKTLGASRFARMYDDLGEALDSAGDYEAAIDAYEHALDCAPRAVYLRTPLATDLMYLNRYEEAREVADEGSLADESALDLNAVVAELDFIDERWNDAIPRLRSLATNYQDDEIAAYFQCLSWLAQRASGNARPSLVSRSDPEGWPQPLLATFRGEMDEAEVAKQVDEEKSLERRREILTEALYYIGKRRAIEGDPETGRRYLATAVNLKVHYFVEYHLATADLARRRAP